MPTVDTKPNIHPPAPGLLHPPPLQFRQPVAVRVQANDPTQHATVGADGAVTLKGKVSNRGFVPSFLSVSFDGRQVTVPLSGGQTPAQVVDKLQAALPKGYVAERVGTAGKDSLTFRVMRDGPAPSPKLPSLTQLRAALSANEFHGGDFRLAKPAQLTSPGIAKTFTLSKPPAGMVGGTTTLAHVLKGDGKQVVFEKNVGGRPFYMGPVSWEMLPKGVR